MPRLEPVTRTIFCAVMISFLVMPALAGGQHVEGLDHGGERHGEVDVAARDVEVEAVGDQRDADQQQEGERQHLGGRVVGDEPRHRARTPHT